MMTDAQLDAQLDALAAIEPDETVQFESVENFKTRFFAKIQTLKNENIVIKTSMMHIRDWGEPCLVLEQDPDIETCLFVERSKNGLIAKMDMMPKGFYKLVP